MKIYKKKPCRTCLSERDRLNTKPRRKRANSGIREYMINISAKKTVT